MFEPKRRSRYLRFDCLEQRQTPSSIMSGPTLVHPLAVSARSEFFHATASAILNGSAPSVVNGPFSAAVKGRASLLGRFTGSLLANPNNGGADIELIMRGKHRSTLRAEMTVLGDGSGGAPIVIHGTFAVTGGRGRMARATGGGTVNGIVTPQTLSLVFHLQGTITA